MKARAQLTLRFEDAATAEAVASSVPLDDQGLVPWTNLGIRIPYKLREDVLPFAVERDGILLDDNAEPREGEGLCETTGTRGLQREPSVLRAQGENMFAIHVDVANLPRILRDDVRYGAGQECIRGTAPELEVGRGPDSQRVPIDRPSTRGPGPEFVEGRLALPEESEGKAGAGRPFAEEDLRRLEGLDIEDLRDNRLGRRPDVIELEGDGA